MPLHKVFAEEKTKIEDGTDRQMVTLQCPVYSPSSALSAIPTTVTPHTPTLATLHITLVLEDIGPLTLKKLQSEGEAKDVTDSVNVRVRAGPKHEIKSGVRDGVANVNVTGGGGVSIDLTGHGGASGDDCGRGCATIDVTGAGGAHVDVTGGGGAHVDVTRGGGTHVDVAGGGGASVGVASSAVGGVDVGGGVVVSPESVEYKVAMELEMWRASEEEAFQVCMQGFI